jgi:predicted component of type VI protein secretion system
MAPQPFQLVMRNGPTPGKVFELNRTDMTIGRDIANDIIINDAEVSRKHARLTAQAAGYVLEDMGSTNGTFVNGQRLMGPHLLRPGEMLLLGENVRLVYAAVQFDPDATMVAASNVPSMPATPSPTPVPPAPRETYVPPSPPPPPAYGERYAPAAPADAYPYEEEPRRSRTWLYIGCGALLLVLCVLIGAAVVFDQLNLYCTPPFDALFACS